MCMALCTHIQLRNLYTADLSAEHAECAIERFAEANFTRINNKSGFLMVRRRPAV